MDGLVDDSTESIGDTTDGAYVALPGHDIGAAGMAAESSRK